jgi:hypothetical protein
MPDLKVPDQVVAAPLCPGLRRPALPETPQLAACGC